MATKYLSTSANFYLIKDYRYNNVFQLLISRSFLSVRKEPKEHALKKNC
jgi:hypothetical protein